MKPTLGLGVQIVPHNETVVPGWYPVVCLSDFAEAFNRGVLRGVDPKGREWQLFTLMSTLPSGEIGKVMYWGDLAAEAKAAVGKAIHVYIATKCTRMAFVFKHTAESVANTFEFAGPSGY